MKINKLNYEVYAIDYIDGTLPNNLKAEMETFLNTHPDIAKDIEMMSEMELVPDTSIKFRAKNDLKKPMSFSILNYMNWIVPVSLSIAFMIALVPPLHNDHPLYIATSLSRQVFVWSSLCKGSRK